MAGIDIKKLWEEHKASKKINNKEVGESKNNIHKDEEKKEKIDQVNETFIPTQLWKEDFRFLKLRFKDKRPTADMKAWQEKNFKFNSPELLEHLSRGGNYGIMGGYGNLILIDSDSEEITDLCKTLPDTFTIKTGSPEYYKKHYYFITDNKMKEIRLSREHVGDLGDIRSVGQYVVAPESTHPKGGKYLVQKDVPIAKVSEQFIRSIFKNYIDEPDNTEIKKYPIDTKRRNSDFIRNCNVPDYVLSKKLKKNTSKNWKLFPYVIDVFNARGVSNEIYKSLAKIQGHDLSAVMGWVKKVKEGKLAKTSCKKMRDYLDKFHPGLKEDICEKCPLYKKVKKEQKEREREKEEKLKNELLEKHKKELSKNEEVISILEDPFLLDKIDKELDKKVVGEHEARKTIFMITNMRNVENLGKATDNIMVNAVSGTGKDYIVEAIFDMIPQNEKEELVRTTPKVLAYTRNKNLDPSSSWKKCALRLEDASNDVLNDDSFKVFSSANPNKTNKGKTINKGKVIEIEIEGKPSIIMTIASANPREELLRRYPICPLDEGINQTKEILKKQSFFAKTGKRADFDEKMTEALSILKRVKVKIPYAEKLIPIFNPQNVIVRTHFPRFLDYIKSSCSLFQYQRKVDKDGFYIAEKKDYEVSKMMLQKTTSNILMIPLDKTKRTILEAFEKNNLQRVSVEEAQEIGGIKEMNISSEWLRKQLDWLKSKSFLIKDKEKRIDEAGRIIPKPVFIYSYNKIQKLEIPKWEELSLNTKVNEVNEVILQELNITKEKKQHKISEKDGKKELSSITYNCKNSSNTSNTSNTQVNELNIRETDITTFEKNTNLDKNWSDSDKKRLKDANKQDNSETKKEKIEVVKIK